MGPVPRICAKKLEQNRAYPHDLGKMRIMCGNTGAVLAARRGGGSRLAHERKFWLVAVGGVSYATSGSRRGMAG